MRDLARRVSRENDGVDELWRAGLGAGVMLLVCDDEAEGLNEEAVLARQKEAEHGS